MNIFIKKESTYNNIISKRKNIEGRLYKGIFKTIHKESKINFCFKDNKISAKIIDIKKYNNFLDFLTNEELKCILPNVNNIEEGIKIYNDYYPNSNDYEVIGIKFILLK